MTRSRESLEAEFHNAMPKSLAQWERGKPVMPGGVIKGAYLSKPFPIYIDRSDGCHLWDLDSHEYVDFASHHTAMLLGHNHPKVVEAMHHEIERGWALGGPTALEAEIAEEMVKRFPAVEKVRFTNSATESSLHLTRLARAVSGKPKVAKFEGAYHGSHDALEISTGPSLSDAGDPDSPESVATWPGMAPGSEENTVVLPYNDPESVELILREHQDDLGGVFYDGKPGMLEIPDSFTHFIRDITKELGMLLIMDETVSFRVGYSGYQGSVGVEPDISLFGKSVGGGVPAGAIGGKAELMDVFDISLDGVRVNQSGTFSGNNLTLAAGLATLQALTPDVYERLDELRLRLHSGLVDVFERAAIPCQVLSAGSLINPFFTDQPVRDYRSAAAIDDELFGRMALGLALKGHYIGSGPMSLALSEPMDDGHVDSLLGAVADVMEEED